MRFLIWYIKSFGLDSYTMSQVISLQAVLYVAVSALLPGALGVSESGFMMLFSTLFPASLLPSAMGTFKRHQLLSLCTYQRTCDRIFYNISEKEEPMTYNILIAKEDGESAQLLKLYLESAGYRTVAASDGEEAFALVETEDIHLAVLDIMMPKLDGYQLTMKIRERGYDFPDYFPFRQSRR